MSKRSSNQHRLLQVISCFALFACAGSFASAERIDAANADFVVAQADLAKQKKALWEQWLDAMARGERSKALGIVRGNRALAAMVANEVGNYGLALFKKGDTAGALRLFQGLFQLYQQLEDEHGMAATEQNIGSAYSASGDCTRALPAFARAAERYEKIGYQPGRESAAKGLGTCAEAVALPDTSLSGIANLQVKGEVQVIVVHPARCLQIGADACEFYLVHEYAHVYLGHVAPNKPWEEGEIEADCWAAKHGRRRSAIAAYDWFLVAPPGISPLGHKSNELRAERIRACARF